MPEKEEKPGPDNLGMPRADLKGGPQSLDNDPEVMAAKKKSLLLQLKLERATVVAKFILYLLNSFRAEAISLVTGAGALVVGWTQVRKHYFQGKREVRAARDSAFGPHAPSTMRAGGSGRGPASTEATTGMPDDMSALMPDTLMGDPWNYLGVAFVVIAVWSSIIAWLKRGKLSENFKMVVQASKTEKSR